MKILKYLSIALTCAITSCTLERTDYEAEIQTTVSDYTVFKEVTTLATGNYKVSVEALNGTFYKGYNEVHLKITNADNNSAVNASSVTFLPINTFSDGGKFSCPHQYAMNFKPAENYFSGYSVFTDESGANGNWQLYISFKVDNQLFNLNKSISVQEQTNKNLNMASFVGKDGEKYYIALVSPQRPKVAENSLVAGIYKYDKPANPSGTFPDPSQFSFSKVNGFTLKLDPRMPDPSMGNHSSPNNKDLAQESDGLYHGVVNYTMTGNWTLNLILLDAHGNTIKGTAVPTDFTPGVEGVKSELYIDILF